MRIWSLHPKYMDSKGLVALWRETLLAKQVLEGRTKGYLNHPQLNRFRQADHSIDAVNLYLETVYHEAVSRGYKFNREKIGTVSNQVMLTVTIGQLKYEAAHFLKKLKKRDPARYIEFSGEKKIEPHPLFSVIEGEIEPWEIIQQ